MTEAEDRRVRKTRTQWLNENYRPAMAWLYFAVCMFDFILFPLLMMVLPKYLGIVYVPWIPLTLQGGGLIHVSFGAIIGIASWGRTKEKLTEQGLK